MSNRLRGLWRVVALAAVVFVAGSSTAQAQKLIRWKFTSGQTTRYLVEQEQSQNIKIGDTAITMTVTVKINMTQKVDAVDSQGVASVTQTIDRMQMKMSPPPGTDQGVDYDSDSPKPAEGIAAVLAPMIEALVKKPFTMKIDPRGQVTEMKLPAGLTEALAKAGGSMQGMFSEDALKQMTGQGMLALAEKPVAQGDTWPREVTVDMPMLGTMKTTTKYRYEGTEKARGQGAGQDFRRHPVGNRPAEGQAGDGPNEDRRPEDGRDDLLRQRGRATRRGQDDVEDEDEHGSRGAADRTADDDHPDAAAGAGGEDGGEPKKPAGRRRRSRRRRRRRRRRRSRRRKGREVNG